MNEPGLLLRPMVESDIAAVAALDRRAFGPTGGWPESAFADEARYNRLSRYTVLEEDGAIVGYVGCWLVIDEVHLVTIGVDPARQGRGLGETLLLQALVDARRRGMESITLEVRESNEVAQRLYAKHGFAQAGRRRRYYSDTKEDALILRRALRGPDVDADLAERVRRNRERLGRPVLDVGHPDG